MKTLNLQFLKKSRLKQGDIFAMLMSDGKYLFGRIIRDKLTFQNSPFGGSYLIYIYNVRSPDKTVDYSRLNPDNLLIPPMYTSNILWNKGYAVKVANFGISNEDLLKQHCFYSTTHKEYLDENGVKIARKTEPCGEWTYVVGLGYIDNKISDALNIKRAPMIESDLFYFSGRGEKIWLKKTLSELKKYSSYEEIIEKYPEVVER